MCKIFNRYFKPLNSKAFTLFEVLCSSLLIAIVSVVLFSSFVISFNYLRCIIEMRTATLVLQEQISNARELSFAEIQALGTSFTSSTMDSLTNAVGTISQSSYSGSSEIVQITYRIDWTSFSGAQKNITFVTLMTDNGLNKK